MEKIYNKLVRDLIPEIILRDNCTPVTRILDEEEDRVELERKLLEEYNEVLLSSGKDRIEELADMYEIIKCLALAEGSSIDEVADVAQAKVLKRGGFEKRIYLEKSIE